AGGDGGSIIGAIVFIFIVLLITDILGLTKVFNFTRSVR
ncbi:PA2779 family protein, partial [Sulfuricurvum sp. RIFOXYD12_FULL_44_77]